METAFLALVGVLLGSAVTSYWNRRTHRRGLVEAAIKAATADFEQANRLTSFAVERGQLMQTPVFASYLFFHMRLAERAEKGTLNKQAIGEIMAESSDFGQAIRDNQHLMRRQDR